MLEQTKRAIDILLDCGFVRSEFSCRTKSRAIGYSFTATVDFKCSTDRILELVDQIIAHRCKTVIYYLGRMVSVIHVEMWHHTKDPTLEVISL